MARPVESAGERRTFRNPRRVNFHSGRKTGHSFVGCHRETGGSASATLATPDKLGYPGQRTASVFVTGKVVNKLLYNSKSKSDVSYSVGERARDYCHLHLARQMRKKDIRILIGDSVQVEVSPYDLQRGPITWRDP